MKYFYESKEKFETQIKIKKRVIFILTGKRK